MDDYKKDPTKNLKSEEKLTAGTPPGVKTQRKAVTAPTYAPRNRQLMRSTTPCVSITA
jgi:hypothetical protein